MLLSDTDECVLGTNDCDPKANCINADGSFYCICQHDLYGNGKICVNSIGNIVSNRYTIIIGSFYAFMQ